ncbi:exonuclease domain-containing protein [Vibrio quintilis]|uniref:DNA polymerase III PolC-type n=1 Tax=Vibrio quintilis TaxID=1117707 RepID=A0A1M7Z006_9VIBR|nr:exonuclease domain-containing protein [Vibrio quintilis]SHO58184.1 DNA polymerase III PolC-type [Vibrio quintilis]
MFEIIRQHISGWRKLSQQHKTLAESGIEWTPGLANYFNTPLPEPDALVLQQDMIALDFETSGIEAGKDQILSVGWVPMNMSQIDLDASKEIFIKHPEYVSADSATINQIVPEALRNGVDLDDAMSQLFDVLAGKIPVVHGACIEKQFIEAYLKQRFGIAHFPCFWIDTLRVEKSMTFSGKTTLGRSFQLQDVRSAYGLPAYNAHSAAIDALSAAELLIAQVKSIFKNHPPRLSKIAMF